MDRETIRKKALEQKPLGFVKLHIPEWQADVQVKRMTVAEREAWEDDANKAEWKNARERLAIHTTYDGSCKAVFTHADIPALSKTEAKALDRIFGLAMQLNGLRREELEAMEQDFAVAQQDASSSS